LNVIDAVNGHRGNSPNAQVERRAALTPANDESRAGASARLMGWTPPDLGPSSCQLASCGVGCQRSTRRSPT
jgi:hypothetical protein